MTNIANQLTNTELATIVVLVQKVNRDISTMGHRAIRTDDYILDVSSIKYLHELAALFRRTDVTGRYVDISEYRDGSICIYKFTKIGPNTWTHNFIT